MRYTGSRECRRLRVWLAARGRLPLEGKRGDDDVKNRKVYIGRSLR